jgi:hypothetical protein
MVFAHDFEKFRAAAASAVESSDDSRGDHLSGPIPLLD